MNIWRKFIAWFRNRKKVCGRCKFYRGSTIYSCAKLAGVGECGESGCTVMAGAKIARICHSYKEE